MGQAIFAFSSPRIAPGYPGCQLPTLRRPSPPYGRRPRWCLPHAVDAIDAGFLGEQFVRIEIHLVPAHESADDLAGPAAVIWFI